MADPWTEFEASGSNQVQDSEGARWVITRGLALALVVILALLALKTS